MTSETESKLQHRNASIVVPMMNSMASGLLSSLSSVFGKLGMTGHDSLILNVLFIGLNVFVTVFAIVFQTRALQGLSTLTASITSMASNFIFTSVFGLIIFGEILSYQWYLGYCFIMAGFILIMRSESVQ